MILTKLKLENFKRYEQFTLEFNQGLVGIIGKNGSGKSTIFEAIFFALYGELKTKGYKEVVRNANATSKDPVVVELEFEYEGVDYSVRREFRGKTLSANAKFFKADELVTTGAKEVTTSIVNLIKMSKDAFLHTLFASQKELTSLSSLKNEDRKKMIRKLLGLEKIDFIEKELIEKSRELKREITAFAEFLMPQDEIEQKKKQKEEYELLEKELKQKQDTKTKHLDETTLKSLDSKKALDLLQQTKDKKQDLFSKCELLKSTINSHLQNSDKLKQELESLDLKQKELKGLESVKQEYTQLHEAIKKQEELKQADIKKQSLLQEQENLREHYKKSRDTISRLEFETSAYTKAVEKQKSMEETLDQLAQNIKKSQLDINKLSSQIAGEQKLIEDINKKIENIQLLGKDSACPTCTRPLLEEYDLVLNSLELIVNKTEKEKIDTLKEQKELLEVELKKLDETYKSLSEENLELSKNINLMENQKRDLLSEKEHFEKVKEQGLKNKVQLEKLENINYVLQEHEELLEKQKHLKQKYEYALSLEAMLKRVDSVKEDLDKTNENIKKYELEYNEKELEYKSVAYDTKQHEEKKKEYEQILKTKDEILNELNDIKVQVATMQGQIKNINQALSNNDKQLEKLGTKQDDLKDYDKIKISLASFKTKLNAKVAPRISDIASTMYSQITKGKYQHIEVSNDFDFYIYDEGKKYPIERFSGGEVDLANLVLRIAISKTLTELSGNNSIGFLAFDEVFGSQDENRRIEILEAFHTIKEQYRQIFLISHEIEIKEMFENIIEL